MFSSLFFIVRIALAWLAVVFAVIASFSEMIGGPVHESVALAVALFVAWVALGAIAHVRRVRLVAGYVDGELLSNRQRRELAVALPGEEAFDQIDGAIRELPGVADVLTVRDSLQVFARLKRGGLSDMRRPHNPLHWLGGGRHRLRATVMPGACESRVTLTCEPETGVWADLFFVDDGAVDTIESIARSMARRVLQRRCDQRAACGIPANA
jgi:hypothetical protein